MRVLPRWPVVAGILTLLLPGAWPAASSADTDPRRSGLVERTGRRLAQLDVTVTGPADRIADLGREDFTLVVSGEYLDDFIVDRVCRAPAAGAGRESTTVAVEQAGPAEPVAPAPPAPTFLFYFDQVHLTMAGRHRAMQMAKEFIPTLVKDGARGMIVSNADALETAADLTSDVDRLLAAVERLEDDRAQWEFFAQEEDSRVADVIRTMRISSVDAAKAVARQHQKEERRKTAKALRRFAMVLGRLADLDPPKVVLYFSDTMRRNAGEHYVSFFPESEDPSDLRSVMQQDAFTGTLVLDKVIAEAAAHGIRVYPIHAQGLRASFQPGLVSRERRITDAEDSLHTLALETGGRAFVGGYKYKNVVATIERDLECLYLISFDPTLFAEDTALPVRLEVDRPGVKVQVRGQIVVQSESARLTSRLLAAFGAPSAIENQAPIRGSVLPIGFSGGRYDALVQVLVPGVQIAPTAWDLGATVISDDKIALEESGRVQLSGPGVPVVLEAQASFRPGPYAVVAVAHEQTTDQTASREVRGSWPNPREQPVSIAAMTVVQPRAGVFYRDGEIRNSGSLVLDENDFARTDAPTAFVGLVCWDGLQKRALRVERSLSGDSAAAFEPLRIEPDDQRCASVRDVVPAGTMTPGLFDYEITVYVRDEVVARATRRFAADGPAAARNAAGADAPLPR